MNPSMQESNPGQRPATLFSTTCHHVVKTHVTTSCHFFGFMHVIHAPKKEIRPSITDIRQRQEVEAIHSNGSRFQMPQVWFRRLLFCRGIITQRPLFGTCFVHASASFALLCTHWVIVWPFAKR